MVTLYPVKPTLLERSHSSRFSYEVKMAAGYIQSNAETQSHIIQQASKYMDFILF